MATANEVLGSLSKIMRYPSPKIVDQVGECKSLLEEYSPELSGKFQRLMEYFQSKNIHELEEYYTMTFDLSPQTFPYAAYQIYGEEYKRGLMLAGLKSSYGRYGIDIENELPDYVPLLLELYTHLTEAKKANALRDELILPGIKKMKEELEKKKNVYFDLVDIVSKVLEMNTKE